MAGLPGAARELIESEALGHLVTMNADGSPQVTCIWVGLDGDELVFGQLQRPAHVHLGPAVKFPPMGDPPPGFAMRVTVERVGGVGPWT